MKEKYKEESSFCRGNLEMLLAGLPFHMPSTFDYVFALVLAVSGEPFPREAAVTDKSFGREITASKETGQRWLGTSTARRPE